jgi:putative acetyltransferase
VAEIIVRAEMAGDFEGIRRVNRLAFGQDREARLVDRLRDGGSLLVSLVAAEEGEIVGHIAFSDLPLDAGSTTLGGAALAPMCVTPSRQRQGIGSLLIREGLQACRKKNVAAVVVLGHADYYPRFGFSVEKAESVRCAYSGPHLMALELTPGVLSGVAVAAKYPAAFAEMD